MALESQSRDRNPQPRGDNSIPSAQDIPSPPSYELSDHWLDEALRTVPLPNGFLTRMSQLVHTNRIEVTSGDQPCRESPSAMESRFEESLRAAGNNARRRGDSPRRF